MGSDWLVQLVFGLFPNQRVKFAIRDAMNELAHVIFSTCDLKFYPAVWQVPHPAGHIESFSDVAHGKPKTDALDVTFVQYLKGHHHAL
jgi:hypothetical protein